MVILLVFLFLMILISIIFLIGEKKWMLMNLFVCFDVFVNLVIGRVEVLVVKM